MPRTFEELHGLRARGLVRVSTKRKVEIPGPVVQRRDAMDCAAKWDIDLPHVPDADPGKEGFDGAFYTGRSRWASSSSIPRRSR